MQDFIVVSVVSLSATAAPRAYSPMNPGCRSTVRVVTPESGQTHHLEPKLIISFEIHIPFSSPSPPGRLK